MKTVRFEAAVPQFTVPELVRTTEYYRDVLGFQIAGVDELAAELGTRGGNILDGPEDRIYKQRELVVQDCNGLILCFAQDISQRAT